MTILTLDVTTLIVLCLVLPLISAVLIAALGRWPNLRDGMMVVMATILCGVVCKLVPLIDAGARPELNLVNILPGDHYMPLGFKVEPLGMLFALVASCLYILTAVYAVGYMRGHHEKNQTRFFVCFALAIFAAIGVAFARNVMTLFVFYEVLTLSTYPLVTHHGTDAARRSGRVYLGILLTTSVSMLLLAMIWTYFLAGTLEFTPGGILTGHVDGLMLMVLLGLYAFGTGKAALMPFHRWLPAAMVAPTPVSALLHAVAVVKAGVFTILKVGVYVFGIDLLAGTGASVWLMYVAGFTLICASLVALSKDNLKERLAYSTISQLAYIVLGMALANPDGVLGGALHIATHAVGKITLFFCAGAIYVQLHKTQVSELDGMGRRMPWTFAAFTIASISIIGLPPMGGAWSKWFLALGAADAHQYPLLAALMISSLLNIAYLLPIPMRAFFAKPKPDGRHDHDDHGHAHVHDGLSEGWAMTIPLCITALGCIAMFYFADPLYHMLQPIAAHTQTVVAPITAAAHP
ncbi:MAG: monovalent cation/H+ antiporter subunit D family protein [Phycisphaera sp.]|nr:monovalent cation/H+ antiporter subunit D family protein [Phycisphaera sp.]